jgi:hydroxysqualene synthase
MADSSRPPHSGDRPGRDQYGSVDNDQVTQAHYENFPVASWLCPAPIRPAVTALYSFARTADDIADEGDTCMAQRQEALVQYRADLDAVASGRSASGRWPDVFAALARVMRSHALPVAWLHALLDAFEQDLRDPPYADREALLDYCAHSANPVGRLLLHLYGVGDALSLRQSDAICSALQLINFWQDLSVDLPRHRVYVPEADLKRLGSSLPELLQRHDTPASRALVRELVRWAHGLMAEGAPLALRLPGRAGWELRLVVQGGLRILEKIGHMDHASLCERPVLRGWDAPLMLWRALRMT